MTAVGSDYRIPYGILVNLQEIIALVVEASSRTHLGSPRSQAKKSPSSGFFTGFAACGAQDHRKHRQGTGLGTVAARN